jgi:type II secretory pathway component PulF
MIPAPIDYATPTDERRSRLPGFSLVAFFAVAIPIFILYLFIELYIPRMEVLFKDYGVKLPHSTQVLLDVAWFARTPGYLGAACVPIVAGFLVPLLVRSRPQLRRRSTWIIALLLLNAMLLAILILVMTVFLEPLITLLRAFNP